MSDDYDFDDLRRTWVLADAFALTPDNKCIVVGAYKGKVMQFMYETYGCDVVGYEPQLWASQLATNHLAEVMPMSKWTVYPVGLTDDRDGELCVRQGGELDMGEYGTDGASLINDTRAHGVGEFVDARYQILDCDLMIMNIEGYEYKLIPYLARTDKLKGIKALALQMHVHPGLTNLNDVTLTKRVLTTRYGVPKADFSPQWVYYKDAEKPLPPGQ